jgi:hypothetical protein
MYLDDALRDQLTYTQYQAAKSTLSALLDRNFTDALTLVFNASQPESHLEAIFAIWWEALSRGTWRREFSDLQLQGQTPVVLEQTRYRLDFSVTTVDTAITAIAARVGVAPPLIAIELDGHDFHERTKAQAIARNQRDRDLQGAGWDVFHVSGSELVSNPAVCVGEVLDRARDAYARFIDTVMLAFASK